VSPDSSAKARPACYHHSHSRCGAAASASGRYDALARWRLAIRQMNSQPSKDDPNQLNYARPSSEPNERGAWIGLIITLAFCLAAAIVYLAR
jgi:hypothetical protein